ncbi:hypothetical protein LTR78_001637 [Recurvomyces mirabilis]|uniref:U-box domain-containing protein n=1 Tax=Recurvomyces mirabilis TaxID=574656 RepID=A0AAE0WVF0_9PEZI|nr:hypothetical protein LTR78_001637 [Recurvomyces mirabilis]KAK5151793.1 hypothetical protein LTS14_008925 [Recurvomyces mirabilis]
MASYAAEQLKEKGNVAFRNGEYLEAEDFYSQAIHRYSRNSLIFTNRANVRLKLQRYDGVVDDSLKSIEIQGQGGQNHKAFYFLGMPCDILSGLRRLSIALCRHAQAQLSLNHPNEALSSALTAYNQVLHPQPAAKISPKDLETFSAFVLKCKKQKFASRERERLRRRGDLCAELEVTLDSQRQRDQSEITLQLQRGDVGNIAASERAAEIRSAFDHKVAELHTIFAAADPANHKAREIPDHIIDTITFEPMHDPVMTKTGHSYERATIYEHLKRSPTDPLTREPLTIDELRPNFGLKAACEEFWDSGASEWIIDW